MAETQNTGAVIEKLGPAIDIYKKTFAENRERVDRALAVGKKIISVQTEEEDQLANNYLAKANTTLSGIKTRRLASTKILDDAKAWAMGPEKELAAEMERIRALRDERARKMQAEAEAKRKEIERQKAKEMHVGQVKAAMKQSVELGVAKRLQELEASISKAFDACTLEGVDTLAKRLKIKPSLKEEFFDGLLSVSFDSSLMTVEEFVDLKARAKAYFSFEKVNGEYIAMAEEIIEKWTKLIPAKRKELETLAKAQGEEAEKLKAKIEERRRAEEERRKEELAAQEAEIKRRAAEEEAEASLNAEFNAQVQAQEIETAGMPSGTRKVKRFRLDPATERDFVKLSTVIGKIVLNVLSEKENDGIFKRTRDKAIKLDADGRPEYVEGVQYWLDQIAKVPYMTEKTIPGLILEEKVSTVAKAK